ncbi:hypothetical protein AC1031_003557 [Aphanomyces cochlioides]|nr:hypothetical protein AC1031_003557 [Aphanomyces cochlioides]
MKRIRPNSRSSGAPQEGITYRCILRWTTYCLSCGDNLTPQILLIVNFTSLNAPVCFDFAYCNRTFLACRIHDLGYTNAKLTLLEQIGHVVATLVVDPAMSTTKVSRTAPSFEKART